MGYRITIEPDVGIVNTFYVAELEQALHVLNEQELDRINNEMDGDGRPYWLDVDAGLARSPELYLSTAHAPQPDAAGVIFSINSVVYNTEFSTPWNMTPPLDLQSGDVLLATWTDVNGPQTSEYVVF